VIVLVFCADMAKLLCGSWSAALGVPGWVLPPPADRSGE
jgi:hypothetical protein